MVFCCWFYSRDDRRLPFGKGKPLVLLTEAVWFSRAVPRYIPVASAGCIKHILQFRGCWEHVAAALYTQLFTVATPIASQTCKRTSFEQTCYLLDEIVAFQTQIFANESLLELRNVPNDYRSGRLPIDDLTVDADLHKPILYLQSEIDLYKRI